ncbi:unnamed protein product [Microthlaspi erraticum]|uniref:Uncharacterized protein n=1 Tax=Microthlaspi erraticum TaxID=1685480 RepID=A0A6D2HWC4_9BRAS|nr:unnamed protein product [Microthlaspi erraticum]
MDFIKTSSLRALIELTFQRNWNGLIWMSRKGVTTKRDHFRPSEVSAKVQNRSADHASRPGKLRPAVGHATTAHATTAHDHAARPGKQSFAAAQPVSSTMAEKSSANLHPSDHSGRPRIRPATTVLIVLGAAMTRSSGRSQDSTPPPRTPCSHYWHGREPSSRPCEQAGEDVECQSRFISRLVRVVRHIAPERLFRPSSTAREPYEPDLGEFSLDSELGSEGDDPIDEEESSSHCHT